jgi:hypothetical protein
MYLNGPIHDGLFLQTLTGRDLFPGNRQALPGERRKSLQYIPGLLRDHPDGDFSLPGSGFKISTLSG